MLRANYCRTFKIVCIFTLTMLTNSISADGCPIPCLCHNTTVDCSNKNLTTLPDIKYPNITNLYLSMNNLESIPLKAFDSFTNLQHLNMAHNKLKNIDAVYLGSLPQLKTLNLSHNNLQELISKQRSPDVVAFPNIEQIDFSHNKIKRIYMYLSKFSKAKTILLSHNELEVLDSGYLYGTNNLQTLYLDNNKLKTLAQQCFGFSVKLKSLYLANNSIRSVTPFTDHAKIRYIDLSMNYLEELKSGSFEGLSKLNYLDLSENKLWHISPKAFDGLQNLLLLNLSSNKVRVADHDTDSAFLPLRNLRILDLSNNKNLYIPAYAFKGLHKLNKLNLLKNEVEIIETNAFTNLRSINSLQLRSHSLLCDCAVKWLQVWLSQLHDNNNTMLRCDSPVWLRGKSVDGIMPATELACSNNLKPLKHLVRPAATLSTRTRYAHIRHNMSLNCTATSSRTQPMRIAWFMNGGPLEGDHTVFNTNQERTSKGVYEMVSVLFVGRVEYGNEGNYVCCASNVYGSDVSHPAIITVVEAPRPYAGLKSVLKERSGGSILIPCLGHGRPSPKTKFIKLQQPDISFNAMVESRRVDYVDNQIQLTDLKIEDSGLYSCYANTIAGSFNKTITIVVEEKPKFASLMKSQSVKEGGTGLLECVVSGNPQPKITWLKHPHSLVVPSKRVILNNHLLVIKEFSSADRGKYICRASNKLGHASQTASLTLSTTTTGENARSPLFITVVVVTAVAVLVITSLVWVALICFCCKRRHRNQHDDDKTTPAEEQHHNGLSDLPHNYTLKLNGQRISAPIARPLLNDYIHQSHDSDYSTLDSSQLTAEELPPAPSVKRTNYTRDDEHDYVSAQIFTQNIYPPNKNNNRKQQPPLHRKQSNSYLLFGVPNTSNNKNEISFTKKDFLSSTAHRHKWSRDHYMTSSSGVESEDGGSDISSLAIT